MNDTNLKSTVSEAALANTGGVENGQYLRQMQKRRIGLCEFSICGRRRKKSGILQKLLCRTQKQRRAGENKKRIRQIGIINAPTNAQRQYPFARCVSFWPLGVCQRKIFLLFSRSCSRKTLRRTLPMPERGRLSTNSTWRGTL